MSCIVVCREDRKDDGSPGDYTLATRTIFPNKEAAEKYASECAPERESLVVEGRFEELRQDFEERFGKQTQAVFASSSSEVVMRRSEATGQITMETRTWPDSRMTRP